jgi:phosphoglycolate phosphatase-like HAD superfamily hydrolase
MSRQVEAVVFDMDGTLARSASGEIRVEADHRGGRFVVSLPAA